MYRKHDQLDRAQISPQDIEKMARFMKECYKDGTCEKSCAHTREENTYHL